jgi:sporulation protein YlmC with PRC-barrel domain
MQDVRTWQGNKVMDRSGNSVGKIGDVYFDEQTGRPEWALVHTGLFGMRHNFVPLNGSQKIDNDTVRVTYDEAKIKKAPSMDVADQLSQQQERQLYEYYGMDWGQAQTQTTSAEGMQQGGTPGQQGQGTTTRSEDETVRRPSETVRLNEQQGQPSDQNK